jgi:hypothetical protein
VTICIAAFAEIEEQLVFVADSRVAFGDFSTDKGAVKAEILANGYVVLIAGNDIVYALPTIRRAKLRVESSGTFDADEVAEILQGELCKTREQVIEAKVLKKYKMSASEFINRGKKVFTDSVFYDICGRIERENLSLEFIVAGFDKAKKPHIRVVSANEPPHDYDGIGYAAIGTGAPAALASLSFAKDHSGFGRDSDLEDAASHLLAAKYMAESATDVGKDTYFFSIGFKRGICHIMKSNGVMECLRRAWEKDGAPRHSKRAKKILKDIIFEQREHFLSLAVLSRCFKYFSSQEKKFFKLCMDPETQQRIMGSKSGRQMLSMQVGSQTSRVSSDHVEQRIDE